MLEKLAPTSASFIPDLNFSLHMKAAANESLCQLVLRKLA